MKYKRSASLSLAVLLLLSGTVYGCGGGSVDTDTTAVSDPDTSAASSDTVDNSPKLDAVNCNGRTYTILAREPDGGYVFCYPEFAAEEQNADTINDAVFARNRAIEDKYNLKLAVRQVSTGSVVSNAQTSILAGDNSFDLIMPMHIQAFSLEVDGMLQNIAEIPNIDPSKPWWMSSIMDNTSIGGRNYFITGDLNLSTLNGVGAVYFNKQLAEERKIDDLYSTVREGRWTIDKFSEYCKGITEDINGDTKMDGEDMFGLTLNGFAWQPLFAGCGSAIVSKDKDDLPSFNWDSEKNIGIISKLVGFLNDRGSVILVNQFPELQDAGGWGNASISMFTENRALFWIEIIYGVLQLRNMNTEFGILPMPKYDEKQENYSSYVHPNHTSTCCVPITNTELDLAGRILEDMAYQSSVTVRPAYYDVTLKGKVARDNESGEMLDIIYSNINLDPALIMSGMGVDGTMREFMINNVTGFASTIASLKPACSETIRSNTEAILEN